MQTFSSNRLLRFWRWDCERVWKNILTQSCLPSVNFINFLWAAFTRTDPKSAKITVNFTVFFALLGSGSIKAAHRKLVKLTTNVKEDLESWWNWPLMWRRICFSYEWIFLRWMKNCGAYLQNQFLFSMTLFLMRLKKWNFNHLQKFLSNCSIAGFDVQGMSLDVNCETIKYNFRTYL